MCPYLPCAPNCLLLLLCLRPIRCDCENIPDPKFPGSSPKWTLQPSPLQTAPSFLWSLALTQEPATSWFSWVPSLHSQLVLMLLLLLISGFSSPSESMLLQVGHTLWCNPAPVTLPPWGHLSPARHWPSVQKSTSCFRPQSEGFSEVFCSPVLWPWLPKCLAFGLPPAYSTSLHCPIMEWVTWSTMAPRPVRCIYSLGS